MPLYEYLCKTCGEKEERIQGFSAPTEHDCPKCGKTLGMARQISVSGFSLAGGGWHSQGYSGPAPAKDASKEASPAAAPAEAPKPCAGGCACHSPRVQSLKDNS